MSLVRLIPSLTLALVVVAPAWAQPSATEDILPFTMKKRELPNPVWKARTAVIPHIPKNTARTLRVFFHFPAGIKPAYLNGVVYLFHGGSGSAVEWLEAVEGAALVDALVRNDFGVVLTESTHRPHDTGWTFPDPTFPGATPPRWIKETANADEVHIRKIHATLIKRGKIIGRDSDGSGGPPVFLAGFSSGGRFSSAMARLLKQSPPPRTRGDRLGLGFSGKRNDDPGELVKRLRVRGVAIYCHTGSSFAFGNASSPGSMSDRPYSTPTIFLHAKHDPKNTPALITGNKVFLDTLGVPAIAFMTTRKRLRPDRMARVVGVSYAQSVAIYEHLRDNSFLHPVREVPLEGALTEVFSLSEHTRSQRAEFWRQLLVLRADHMVMSDNHDKTVTWFKIHR